MNRELLKIVKKATKRQWEQNARDYAAYAEFIQRLGELNGKKVTFSNGTKP